ncbi:MAG TPA: hypothetical protein VJ011_03675, partial [Steroidobacteraceae bacterium]|nr:hypothetical protein [Steroidobacteraceae bacterium]
MSYEHCEKHDCDATNGCPRCAELQAAAEHPRTADPRDPEFEQKLVELWRSSGAIFHNATVAGVAAELRRLLERPALPAPAEVGSVLDRLERAWSLTLDAERQEH